MVHLSHCVLEPAFVLQNLHSHLKNRVLQAVQAKFLVSLVLLLVVAVVAVAHVAVLRVAHVALVAVVHVGHVLGRAHRVWVLIVVQTARHKGVIVAARVLLAAVAHVLLAAVAHVVAAHVVAAHAVAVHAVAAHAAAAHAAAAGHVEDAVDRVRRVDVVPAALAVAVHAFPLVSLALLILGISHLAHSPQVLT